MENRKSQIIEIALRNIREKGYLSFSYDDLAKEIGVTKASIHYHFEKKEDLGLAICARIKKGLDHSYIEIANTKINIEDKIWEFISSRAEQISPNEICPISSMQTDYNFLPVTMQASVQQLSHLEIEYVIKLLEESSLQVTQDTKGLAALLISSVKGALQYNRILGENLYITVIAQLKLLINGNIKKR
ncbi:TetR/AcrR family transcriptional regulator [Psychrobacillus sp. NPDC096426]|uniref:TetR/AcrR family transcriptional regulator n=1 Tax=Psychrobacillus sp. NPDC096426 TaxID=3364491 RepID=UPI00380593E7